MLNTVKSLGWRPVIALAATMTTFACGSDAPAASDTPAQGTGTTTSQTSTSPSGTPQAGRGPSGTTTGTPTAGAGPARTSASSAGTSGSVSAAAGANAAGSGGVAASTADDSDAGTADPATTVDQPASGRPPLTSLKYPTTKEKVDEAPTFNITRPMDLNVTEGKLPVVVWANGGCFRSDFTWTPLFERWASAGFVVLALTGTGGDDDIVGMLSSTTNTEHGQLVDWVEKANASGPYAGKLDMDRIVASGNSCGGVTALELTAKDKRIDAVFVLSGSSAVGSVNTEVMSAVNVPVGYVTGSPSEDVAAPNASDDYDAMNDGLPGLLVQRTMGDHVTVSTDEKILPEDAEISLNWLDLALYGNKQAHDVLTSPKVCDNCTPDTWTVKSKNLEKLIK